MTPTSLTLRVTADAGALIAVAPAAAFWLGGVRAAPGVGAGGVLALGNFRWVTARAAAVVGGGAVRAGWYVGAALRFAAFAAACGVLLGTGAAHPLGLVAGLTVLPCALIVRGLAAARDGA